MLLFCLIFIYPVSRTAIMSFFSVKSVTSAVSTWSWAGLDNYIKLFHTPLFITSVINIGKIWLYCGIACLGLAIVLAIILTSGLRGQKFFRAIIYMPTLLQQSPLVICGCCMFTMQSSACSTPFSLPLAGSPWRTSSGLVQTTCSSQCASLMYSAMWATSC